MKKEDQILFEDEVNPILWGHWTCPVCGEELQDPNSVVNTICHSKHEVTLTYAEVSGDERIAYLRKF